MSEKSWNGNLTIAFNGQPTVARLLLGNSRATSAAADAYRWGREK